MSINSNRKPYLGIQLINENRRNSYLSFSLWGNKNNSTKGKSYGGTILNENFLTQKQVNEFFAAQERRLLTYLAKYGVRISEKDIKQQEKDFAKEHGMNASDLGVWKAYKDAFSQNDS